MRRALSVLAVLTLATGLVSGVAEAGVKHRTVKGHVIQVEQQVRTQNQGTFDRLTIRTRQGDEMRLHLGDVGECPGCYAPGDEIRVRLRLDGDPGNECLVRKMRLRRDGRTLDFRYDGHRVVHHQERGHHGGRHGHATRSGRGGRGGGPS